MILINMKGHNFINRIIDKSNAAGRFFVVVLALLLVPVFVGCASSDNENQIAEDGLDCVYYLNTEGTRLERVGFEHMPKENALEEVNVIAEKLRMEPQSAKLKRTLGIYTDIVDSRIDGNQLILSFDENYYNINKAEEVLFRAAIVKSMCQIEGVTTVVINIENKPLVNSKGELVGAMNAELFVDNPGRDINAYDHREVVLYFANSEGNALVAERRTVVYSTNISLEKLVLEKLLEGPAEKEHRATLSPERRINSVTVKEGVCYVDLSEPSTDFTGAVDEEVSIYSIVNTVLEIPDLKKVSIAIDGKTDRTYRGGVSLEQLFEKNLEYIEK